MPPGDHSDDNDDKDDDDDDGNDDQEVCPLENDNSTLIMVLGGETARENRENEHSTSIGNNYILRDKCHNYYCFSRLVSLNAVSVCKFALP